jgi:hypothetical protein
MTQTEKISITERLNRLDTSKENPNTMRTPIVPARVCASVVAFASLVCVLAALSWTIENVVIHQGYETIAFAKPTATHRLIRQTEVAHFGSRVSNAFGIKGEVATEFADWILEASERQQLTPELLASLVITESSFRKDARSNVGAIGPAQVRPDYWGKFCGTSDLSDPEQNVYCGAQVLSYHLERCEGDTDCALAAYNVGPYAKREQAAQRYVTKVGRYLSNLENVAL